MDVIRLETATLIMTITSLMMGMNFRTSWWPYGYSVIFYELLHVINYLNSPGSLLLIIGKEAENVFIVPCLQIVVTVNELAC